MNGAMKLDQDRACAVEASYSHQEQLENEPENIAPERALGKGKAWERTELLSGSRDRKGRDDAAAPSSLDRPTPAGQPVCQTSDLCVLKADSGLTKMRKEESLAGRKGGQHSVVHLSSTYSFVEDCRGCGSFLPGRGVARPPGQSDGQSTPALSTEGTTHALEQGLSSCDSYAGSSSTPSWSDPSRASPETTTGKLSRSRTGGLRSVSPDLRSCSSASSAGLSKKEYVCESKLSPLLEGADAGQFLSSVPLCCLSSGKSPCAEEAIDAELAAPLGTSRKQPGSDEQRLTCPVSGMLQDAAPSPTVPVPNGLASPSAAALRLDGEATAGVPVTSPRGSRRPRQFAIEAREVASVAHAFTTHPGVGRAEVARKEETSHQVGAGDLLLDEDEDVVMLRQQGGRVKELRNELMANVSQTRLVQLRDMFLDPRRKKLHCWAPEEIELLQADYRQNHEDWVEVLQPWQTTPLHLQTVPFTYSFLKKAPLKFPAVFCKHTPLFFPHPSGIGVFHAILLIERRPRRSSITPQREPTSKLDQAERKPISNRSLRKTSAVVVGGTSSMEPKDEKSFRLCVGPREKVGLSSSETKGTNPGVSLGGENATASCPSSFEDSPSSSAGGAKEVVSSRRLSDTAGSAAIASVGAVLEPNELRSSQADVAPSQSVSVAFSPRASTSLPSLGEIAANGPSSETPDHPRAENGCHPPRSAISRRADDFPKAAQSSSSSVCSSFCKSSSLLDGFLGTEDVARLALIWEPYQSSGQNPLGSGEALGRQRPLSCSGATTSGVSSSLGSSLPSLHLPDNGLEPGAFSHVVTGRLSLSSSSLPMPMTSQHPKGTSDGGSDRHLLVENDHCALPFAFVSTAPHSPVEGRRGPFKGAAGSDALQHQRKLQKILKLQHRLLSPLEDACLPEICFDGQVVACQLHGFVPYLEREGGGTAGPSMHFFSGSEREQSGPPPQGMAQHGKAKDAGAGLGWESGCQPRSEGREENTSGLTHIGNDDERKQSPTSQAAPACTAQGQKAAQEEKPTLGLRQRVLLCVRLHDDRVVLYEIRRFINQSAKALVDWERRVRAAEMEIASAAADLSLPKTWRPANSQKSVRKLSAASCSDAAVLHSSQMSSPCQADEEKDERRRLLPAGRAEACKSDGSEGKEEKVDVISHALSGEGPDSADTCSIPTQAEPLRCGAPLEESGSELRENVGTPEEQRDTGKEEGGECLLTPRGGEATAAPPDDLGQTREGLVATGAAVEDGKIAIASDRTEGEGEDCGTGASEKRTVVIKARAAEAGRSLQPLAQGEKITASIKTAASGEKDSGEDALGESLQKGELRASGGEQVSGRSLHCPLSPDVPRGSHLDGSQAVGDLMGIPQFSQGQRAFPTADVKPHFEDSEVTLDASEKKVPGARTPDASESPLLRPAAEGTRPASVYVCAALDSVERSTGRKMKRAGSGQTPVEAREENSSLSRRRLLPLQSRWEGRRGDRTADPVCWRDCSTSPCSGKPTSSRAGAFSEPIAVFHDLQWTAEEFGNIHLDASFCKKEPFPKPLVCSAHVNDSCASVACGLPHPSRSGAAPLFADMSALGSEERSSPVKQASQSPSCSPRGVGCSTHTPSSTSSGLHGDPPPVSLTFVYSVYEEDDATPQERNVLALSAPRKDTSDVSQNPPFPEAGPVLPPGLVRENAGIREASSPPSGGRGVSCALAEKKPSTDHEQAEGEKAKGPGREEGGEAYACPRGTLMNVECHSVPLPVTEGLPRVSRSQGRKKWAILSYLAAVVAAPKTRPGSVHVKTPGCRTVDIHEQAQASEFRIPAQSRSVTAELGLRGREKDSAQRASPGQLAKQETSFPGSPPVGGKICIWQLEPLLQQLPGSAWNSLHRVSSGSVGVASPVPRPSRRDGKRPRSRQQKKRRSTTTDSFSSPSPRSGNRRGRLLSPDRVASSETGNGRHQADTFPGDLYPGLGTVVAQRSAAKRKLVSQITRRSSEDSTWSTGQLPGSPPVKPDIRHRDNMSSTSTVVVDTGISCSSPALSCTVSPERRPGSSCCEGAAAEPKLASCMQLETLGSCSVHHACSSQHFSFKSDGRSRGSDGPSSAGIGRVCCRSALLVGQCYLPAGCAPTDVSATPGRFRAKKEKRAPANEPGAGGGAQEHGRECVEEGSLQESILEQTSPVIISTDAGGFLRAWRCRPSSRTSCCLAAQRLRMKPLLSVAVNQQLPCLAAVGAEDGRIRICDISPLLSHVLSVERAHSVALAREPSSLFHEGLELHDREEASTSALQENSRGAAVSTGMCSAPREQRDEGERPVRVPLVFSNLDESCAVSAAPRAPVAPLVTLPSPLGEDLHRLFGRNHPVRSLQWIAGGALLGAVYEQPESERHLAAFGSCAALWSPGKNVFDDVNDAAQHKLFWARAAQHSQAAKFSRLVCVHVAHAAGALDRTEGAKKEMSLCCCRAKVNIKQEKQDLDPSQRLDCCCCLQEGSSRMLACDFLFSKRGGVFGISTDTLSMLHCWKPGSWLLGDVEDVGVLARKTADERHLRQTLEHFEAQKAVRVAMATRAEKAKMQRQAASASEAVERAKQGESLACTREALMHPWQKFLSIRPRTVALMDNQRMEIEDECAALDLFADREIQPCVGKLRGSAAPSSVAPRSFVHTWAARTA